jgi:hypothetical protein
MIQKAIESYNIVQGFARLDRDVEVGEDFVEDLLDKWYALCRVHNPLVRKSAKLEVKLGKKIVSPDFGGDAKHDEVFLSEPLGCRDDYGRLNYCPGLCSNRTSRLA